MAISQSKQPTMTTPETVYDQPPAPRPNGTNSGKNGLSAGAIAGIAVSGVVACALSFVVGMQVGGGQNSMNNQAGGPPGMSPVKTISQAGQVDKWAVRQVLIRTRLVKLRRRKDKPTATPPKTPKPRRPSTSPAASKPTAAPSSSGTAFMLN